MVTAALGMAVILLGIILLAVCLLQIVGLPGNWIVLAIVVLWKLVGPDATTVDVTWFFILAAAIIAGIGEIMEWLAQIKLGGKFGSSAKGNWGGIIGSFIGAIILLPLFFGFGAILGALAGAYAGCFIVEFICKRRLYQAHKAAWGAFVGRFLGMGLKLGIGIAIVVMSVARMWPVGGL